ncbi:hypothetical protein N7523_010254 [Penicillium sp. IBT 18751x]|nr:hypothetical protein N7523_010254 [Penicillium sp. IBT 18751x]
MAIIQAIIVLCALGAQSLAGPAPVNHGSYNPVPRGVIDSPSFPVPTRPSDVIMKKRDDLEVPQCDWTYGVAYVGSTNENIKHLDAVKSALCVAAPKSCTRVAFTNDSGLFFCNDQNDHPIRIDCGQLIDPVNKLTKACCFANYYTFGVLHDETQITKLPYHLRIAGQGL